MNLAKLTWTGTTWMVLKVIIVIVIITVDVVMLTISRATHPGKLISSIESEAQGHLYPDVLNCSEHVLVRD